MKPLRPQSISAHVPRRRREWVWALKRDFPHLAFSLNGQVEGCHSAARAIAAPVPALVSGAAGARIEGVMIGRAAYSAPWACLADADVAVWGAAANAATCRREVCQNALFADGIYDAPNAGERAASTGWSRFLLHGSFYWPSLCTTASSCPATLEQREAATCECAFLHAVST